MLHMSAVCLCLLQHNELVVGDTSGKLLVYKNDESKPWITRTCVGMVSAETKGHQGRESCLLPLITVLVF